MDKGLGADAHLLKGPVSHADMLEAVTTWWHGKAFVRVVKGTGLTRRADVGCCALV